MEQMMARLLAEIRTNQAKADTSQNKMKEKIRTNQELLKEEMLAKMEARVYANNEKFEVFLGTLICWMDIHQEKMVAAVHFIQSELEETIKHRVAGVLSCVDQKTQGLCKELTEEINETGGKDVPRYEDEECPGNLSRHENRPSWRGTDGQ
jgi:hypothetical protein